MKLDHLLAQWRKDPTIAPNIVVWRVYPSCAAQIEPFPPDLDPTLLQALQRDGIAALYTHQAETFRQIQQGRHPVIVTSTASGKTLAYNLPVMDCLLKDATARALYLFPTKALAHDQKDTLQKLDDLLKNDGLPKKTVSVATYDGDTPTNARPKIRKNARIIITNPDMLHTAILPHHPQWAVFFQNLRFVIIDEIHIYRGVFGSHVANVLRRLRRIAAFYGAHPQFIMTSATIANPQELAEMLTEVPASLVARDGSAKGEKHFIIYNPPIVNFELGIRRSAMLESVRLGCDLLAHQLQTIIFGRSRRTVELILTYLRDQSSSSLSVAKKEASPSIRAYRSGYLPAQRREIEQGLRDGTVRTVVATTALELGIDIGGMNAAILTGYPGTIAAAWQQIGRAGRQNDAALAVLIASANPLDQFLAHHAEYFFERSPEQALVNPNHLLILLSHLRCAAFELPFNADEGFGNLAHTDIAPYFDFLVTSGVLHSSAGRFFWMADQYPAEGVSLRSASADRVLLRVGNQNPKGLADADTLQADGESRPLGFETPKTIGMVDAQSAYWLAHPGAIYIHEGQTYLVNTLDLTENCASLSPIDPDYYTEPVRDTTVQLISLTEQWEINGAVKAHGEIKVTTQVTGYNKIRWLTHERLDSARVDLPPTELQTTGYWIALDETTVDTLRKQALWKNDPNDYGPNWPEQRQKARARDGFRCQICGETEKGRAHDVHHKIPFKQFASLQEANRLDNLTTLCSRCHQRAETVVKMKSGLAGLGFILSHIAPLLLMCDHSDIGVHSDPAAPVADSRPAVIIYDLVPAGIGFSKKLFDYHIELLERAHEVIGGCACADGCPSCVGPAGENGVGGKPATLAILKLLL